MPHRLPTDMTIELATYATDSQRLVMHGVLRRNVHLCLGSTVLHIPVDGLEARDDYVLVFRNRQNAMSWSSRFSIVEPCEGLRSWEAEDDREDQLADGTPRQEEPTIFQALPAAVDDRTARAGEAKQLVLADFHHAGELRKLRM